MNEPAKNEIQLFEDQKIRVAWDAAREEWYFSIVDVVGVLTDSPDYNTGRKYWNKLKQRLKDEGSELVTNCHQLKMRAADGKNRLTDVADTEQLLRIIQSVYIRLLSACKKLCLMCSVLFLYIGAVMCLVEFCDDKRILACVL